MKLRLLPLLAGSALLIDPVFARATLPAGEHGASSAVQGPAIVLNDAVRAIRAELIDLRTDLETSRNAVLEGFAPETSLEDRADALRDWSAANLEAIEALRHLSTQMLDALRFAEVSGRAGPLKASALQRAAQRDLSWVTQSLVRSRQAALDALPPEATTEDRAQALVIWAANNASELLLQKQLRAQISTWQAERSPLRGARTGIAPSLLDRLHLYVHHAGELRQARQQLNRELTLAADDEARKELLWAFRMRFRQLLNERRQLKRLERLTGTAVDGNRRPGG